MTRYFIELAYKGDGYSGFQAQKNANTIQAEVEKALAIYFRRSFQLTGSSRTDAGVHALQNYFHFDTEDPIPEPQEKVYHLNAILPRDIVIRKLLWVHEEAHCRFDAISREYKYCIYNQKNPFLEERAYYYPYKLNVIKLNEAAALLLNYSDFTSFSKRNTQVKNFNCDIQQSEWIEGDGQLVFHVVSNRFLRGMVKGLVGTMLKVGRGIISLKEFSEIIESKDCTKADFSVPSHGLFLVKVKFEDGFFERKEQED